MKKLATLLLCLVALCTTACADNERPIQVSQLPAIAQQFIQKHFAGNKVALAKVDNELLSKNYEVIFSNGDKIDFDSKGNWEEIDCKFSSVPIAAIPAPIQKYIQENYPGETVKKIEKDRKEYELKLSNRVELTFDTKFNLIDIDM